MLPSKIIHIGKLSAQLRVLGLMKKVDEWLKVIPPLNQPQTSASRSICVNTTCITAHMHSHTCRSMYTHTGKLKIKQGLWAVLISAHVSVGLFSLLPRSNIKSPLALADFKLGQFVVRSYMFKTKRKFPFSSAQSKAQEYKRTQEASLITKPINRAECPTDTVGFPLLELRTTRF